VLIVQLPDPGIRVLPPLADCRDRGLDGRPVLGGQVVVLSRGGQEEEDLAEGVELELPVHPVAHLVGAARVSAQVIKTPLVGNSTTIGAVGRLQVRAVLHDSR